VSQIPPTFEGARPRKSPTTVIVVVVLACLACCCLCAVGGGFWAYSALNKNGFIKATVQLSGCMVDFSNVSHAINEYASEHGGKLPDAKTWQDDVRPYYARITRERENQNPFGAMKSDGDWGCDTGGPRGRTGMSFNSNLSGKDLATISDWSTVVVFEIDKPQKNASGPYTVRPLANSPTLGNLPSPRGWIDVSLEGRAWAESNPGSFAAPASWRPKGRKP
jgi:hypothetical protein